MERFSEFLLVYFLSCRVHRTEINVDEEWKDMALVELVSCVTWCLYTYLLSISFSAILLL